MRHLSIIILCFFALTSCGVWNSGSSKLRYVRSDKTEIVIVEREHAAKDKSKEIQPELELSQNQFVQEDHGKIPSNLTDDQTPPPMEEDHLSNLWEEKPFQQHELNHPMDLNPDKDEQIIQEAYEAERAANTSFILMLVGLISIFAPYLGIIPFIIGLIFYAKSDRSRYITQFGERKQRSAEVVMIIDGIILVLWLLLILTLFFL